MTHLIFEQSSNVNDNSKMNSHKATVFVLFVIAKNSICYGEDKIIRMERGFSAKHFPGGIATVFFNSMLRHKDKVAQVNNVIV